MMELLGCPKNGIWSVVESFIRIDFHYYFTIWRNWISGIAV